MHLASSAAAITPPGSLFSPFPRDPNWVCSAAETRASPCNAMATAGYRCSERQRLLAARRLSPLLCSTLALLFYKQAGSLQNHMLGNDESGGCIPCMSWDA